ncbi:hypothetical protein C1I98_06555 [Spongiactinospora gelatinilytica]|uniref:Uncharacterized protein n=1 Tax=Spongiactinospora gelatinilytica TaxID=2666298 RepID=A0A2W2HQX7_9ACTN|nr:hypothetical protein [Spongiactinospora gelatinilytica]PZG52930.1 hypothetical protein C1I98_06555 [Spongiactinospora gelatinilytica]
MGLAIVVGILGAADGPDTRAEITAELSALRRLLTLAGLPAWHEPPEPGERPAEYEMYGYRGLHHLRRLAVHVAHAGMLPPPLAAGGDPSADPLLRAAYDGDPDGGGFDHLVHHSDAEGYYLPVDFADVLYDDSITSADVGSSQRLLAECERLAAMLGLPAGLDPWSQEVEEAIDGEGPAAAGWRRYGVEAFTCLQLISAARRSVITGAALVFC